MKHSIKHLSPSFFFLLFHGIYTIIVCLIDDGFANRFDVDSVCAFGSYLAISWIAYIICKIGKYAYRATGARGSTCLLLGTFSGVFSGWLLFFTHQTIPLLFALTTRQREIMSRLLFATGINCCINGASAVLEFDIIFHEQNKKVVWSDILYWVLAISLDMVVYLSHLPVHWLIYATVISNLVYTIVLLIGSPLLQEPIQFSFLATGLRRGVEVAIQDILAVCITVCYTIGASHLPEKQYALHCIAFGIVTMGEELAVSFDFYTLQRLSHRTQNVVTYAERHIKWAGYLLLGITLFLLPPFLWLYHGVVPYGEVFGWCLIYMSSNVPLVFYYFYDAILNSLSETKYLWISSVIGLFVRLPLLYLVLHYHWGLLGMGLIAPIDFAARVIYLKAYAHRAEQHLLTKR